ncbi:MAG: prepilin peptidase [Planctomycetes bacterium]|nr:prepilin peptidase [Planctomycetota bacterium]
MPPPAFYPVLAALVGLVVGSFLNVVIWRLPRGESLSHPPSRCPGCGKSIRWFQNVPVLSWLLLRGRCAGCGIRIPFRYPFVELLTGALFLAAWLAWQDHPVTALLVAIHLAAPRGRRSSTPTTRSSRTRSPKPGLVAALAALDGPDRPAMLAGVSPAAGRLARGARRRGGGAGVLLALRWIASALKKRARPCWVWATWKALAWIGALVGPVYVLVALVVGCVVGSVIGLSSSWSSPRSAPSSGSALRQVTSSTGLGIPRRDVCSCSMGARRFPRRHPSACTSFSMPCACWKTTTSPSTGRVCWWRASPTVARRAGGCASSS